MQVQRKPVARLRWLAGVLFSKKLLARLVLFWVERSASGVRASGIPRIPLSPPRGNCTHPSDLAGCVFFFLQESFGIVIDLS